MAKSDVVLLGCGDVGAIRGVMETYGPLVRPIFAAADIRFGHCERLYSERGSHQIGGMAHTRVKPDMASLFTDCGFDVVSLASNHGLDWGAEALLDTALLFRNKGIQTTGAGATLGEARQPAVIERNGVRVAFLAYCSVLREGYEAGPEHAGLAPLRVHTYFEPVQSQPGFPPRVVTIPYEEDLKALAEDITEAKKIAHVVVVSLHWGVHFIPRMIAEYQPIVAKAAFAAGADLILGHHAHVPKAIGVYDGKVCFYSLGDFMRSGSRSFGAINKKSHSTRVTRDLKLEAAGSFEYAEYPDVDHQNIDPERRSVIVKAVLSKEGVKKVSFLPVLVDDKLRPEALLRGDKRFDDAVNFMEWASKGFPHEFVVEGDEVLVY